MLFIRINLFAVSPALDGMILACTVDSDDASKSGAMIMAMIMILPLV